MGSLWLIEELCGICTEMSHIIHTQAVALEQLGAMCMEEERVEISEDTFEDNGHAIVWAMAN